MPLAFNVRIGGSIEMEHNGYLGSITLERRIGNTVRMIFRMDRSVMIRVMNHRVNGVTFGLKADAQGPLSTQGGLSTQGRLSTPDRLSTQDPLPTLTS